MRHELRLLRIGRPVAGAHAERHANIAAIRSENRMWRWCVRHGRSGWRVACTHTTEEGVQVVTVTVGMYRHVAYLALYNRSLCVFAERRRRSWSWSALLYSPSFWPPPSVDTLDCERRTQVSSVHFSFFYIYIYIFSTYICVWWRKDEKNGEP